MFRPPRTAVLAAVVATAMGCKRQPEQGAFPEGAVGKVAAPAPPEPEPLEEVPGTEAPPPDHKVGIVAAPPSVDPQRTSPPAPPSTDPKAPRPPESP